MNNIPSATESARLDCLTAYVSTILAHLTGDQLDAALGSEIKRRGRRDSEYRAAALCGSHPDDLAAAVACAGFSLASVGIASIMVAA